MIVVSGLITVFLIAVFRPILFFRICALSVVVPILLTIYDIAQEMTRYWSW